MRGKDFYEEKSFKLGLVPKLIIAIILGILFGQFLPEGFCRFVVTLSGFFSTFLKFVIPMMILAYVTMGIADLSQGAGKLLLITVILAYGSTLIAGSSSFLVASNLFPSFMSAGALDGAICAIMVALYITQDSFGTACNISGDNAIGVIVDTIYKKFIFKSDAASTVAEAE